MAPLAHTTRPRSPSTSMIGGIQRGGRPVTMTSPIPADSAASTAARVRSDTVPSERSSVPSRSVAIRRGRMAAPYRWHGAARRRIRESAQLRTLAVAGGDQGWETGGEHHYGGPPMDAVDALTRIAYLLDRSLADSRKAAAFLRAAEVVQELPADELAARAAAGTLTELKGIGDSTGAVIAQVLAGKVPDRLTELEATTEIPVGEGAEIRRALKGDCHTHSTWSDGGASI